MATLIIGIFIANTLTIAGTNGAHITIKGAKVIQEGRFKAKKVPDKETTDEEEEEEGGGEEKMKLLERVQEMTQSWLSTVSKVFISLGSISYYIGNNLPEFLLQNSAVLGCDDECIRRGMVAGTFFIFVALTTFTFIPTIFEKLNKMPQFKTTEKKIAHKMKKYKPAEVQWLSLRMIALTLQIDTIYSALWTNTIGSINGCGHAVVIGSAATIALGWITWGVYAILYMDYLEQVRETAKKFHLNFKKAGHKHRITNILFFVTVLLFLVTFFPVHIISINQVPLSCGCHGNLTVTNGTLGGCVDEGGVVITRVVLLSYQAVLLTVMAILAPLRSQFMKLVVKSEKPSSPPAISSLELEIEP